MKILMISSYLPYPLHSGGQVRLYNLIKELSGKHEITLICEKRLHQTSDDVKQLEKICKKVITVPRRKQWSLENMIQSGISSRSFLVTGHTQPEMKQKIEEALAKTHFDVIHVETFYVAQNLPETSIPVVLVDHNIEYQIYQRFIDRTPRILRSLLSLDVKKIRKEEEGAWENASKIVAVSEEDKKVMEQFGVTPVVVPNGVNIEEFGFKNKEILLRQGFGGQRKILFIGDFKWLQNRDTVTFIIKEIFPQIKTLYIRNEEDSGQARMTNIKLWIVGRKIPDSIRSLTNDPNILFDEDSSQKPTPEIFQEASVLLAPIRVGGGTSYKILEAMSCGTPVITMPMSAHALAAKDGEHVMVGKTAEELAHKTVQLLENKNIFEKLAKNGRKLIEEKYTWKEVAKKLNEIYNNTVSNASKNRKG